MDEGYPLDPAELRGLVREVIDDHPAALADIPGEGGRLFDAALWTKMAELGWLGLGLAEARGGLGLGIVHLAVLYEELGRGLAAVPASGTLIAADLIGRHGAASLQALLPQLLSGAVKAAVAPDPVPLPLRDGRASGMVADLLFAADADLFLLPVATETDDEAIAVVRAGAPGVTVADRPLVDLTRRMGELRLDSVAVTPGHLLRLPPEDRAAVRDHAAIAIASDSVGGAAAIFERTVEYLGIREQFGRPIGSFQALKHRVASLKVLLEAATALVRNAARAVAEGEAGASALASSAKYYACDAYAAIAGDAVQLHGGIGFTWEHPCHLFLKRAKLNQQLFGTSTFHKERVARLALDAATAKAAA